MTTTKLAPIWIADTAYYQCHMEFRVVPFCRTIMECATVQLVLKEILGHPPTEWWWLLHREEEDELSFARAFDHPLTKIEALLINVVIVKETAQGTFI